MYGMVNKLESASSISNACKYLRYAKKFEPRVPREADCGDVYGRTMHVRDWNQTKLEIVRQD